jgi:hypothetical protein
MSLPARPESAASTKADERLSLFRGLTVRELDGNPFLRIAVSRVLKTNRTPTLHDLHCELFRLFPSLSEDFSSSAHGSFVFLATVHGAKGLGRERVVWLQPSDCPFRRALPPREKAEEEHIIYVAMTRSMRELVLIDLDWGTGNPVRKNKELDTAIKAALAPVKAAVPAILMPASPETPARTSPRKQRARSRPPRPQTPPPTKADLGRAKSDLHYLQNPRTPRKRVNLGRLGDKLQEVTPRTGIRRVDANG